MEYKDFERFISIIGGCEFKATVFDADNKRHRYHVILTFTTCETIKQLIKSGFKLHHQDSNIMVNP